MVTQEDISTLVKADILMLGLHCNALGLRKKLRRPVILNVRRTQ